MKLAVIGLGEVGSEYSVALSNAGHEIVGFDVATLPTPAGTKRAESVTAAVNGAEMILVMTSAAAAPSIAAEAAESLAPGCIYVDFTSASPLLMRILGEKIESHRGHFVDAAILGPVSVHGAGTPLMLSGGQAASVGELFAGLGADVDVIENSLPGEAMAHKLLRSVFMKGIAAVICEAVEAAERAGYVDWTRAQIAAQLAGDGQKVIDRFLRGSRIHGVRRAQEMRDTASYLDQLGAPNTMSVAAASSLSRLAESR